MKRAVLMAMAVGLGWALTARPAAYAVGTTSIADGCEVKVSKESGKLEAAAVKLFRGCFEKVYKCYELLDKGKTQTDVDTCVDALFVVGGKCSDEKLGETNPTTQALAKKEDKFVTNVGKKCDPTILGVPVATILGAATGPLNGMFEKAAAGTTMKAECAKMNPPFLNVDTTYPNWIGCLRKWVIIQSTRQLTIGFHFGWRWWAAWRVLVARGRVIVIDPFPIGVLNITADTKARLNTAVFPADITGITASYTLEIGGVDALTGAAPVTQPASSFTATPVVVGAFGLLVCTRQPTDGQGKVCCTPGGCAALGPKDYTANQDHDSSGSNAIFGFFPGSVTPPDPGCGFTAINSIAGLPAVTTLPCQEAEAKSGACNASAVGTGNPNAHAPRCFGGPRNGLFCNPTLPLASECPAGGVFCASQAPAVFPGFPLVSPCNSAIKLTPAGAGFSDGDMAIASSIQLTLHELTLDNVINATGTPGMDGIPDGFGADLLPCTPDDTTPPQTAAQLPLTTGTTSATVFNANMVPFVACPGFPGIITSSDAGGPVFPPCAGAPSVGATPANACANLSLGSATGYELVAAFPALDGSTTGDTATALREELE